MQAYVTQIFDAGAGVHALQAAQRSRAGPHVGASDATRFTQKLQAMLVCVDIDYINRGNVWLGGCFTVATHLHVVLRLSVPGGLPIFNQSF